jgi:triphosphoribosyl-dephospho-CoA synthase
MKRSELTYISPISHWVRLSCLLEAGARKPGNVHPEASFDDLSHAEMVHSAHLIAPLFDHARVRGVGATILDAVTLTRREVGKNTNLGIILLLAPLCAVPLNVPVFEGINNVLDNLTIDDARQVYQAIRIAEPGGLGRSEQQDVRDEPTVSLKEAMSLAQERDNIARQYANGFDDILHFGLEQLSHELGFVDRWENAVIRLQLQLMSYLPDSLIARKCGPEVAYEAGLRARTVLETDWSDYDITWELLQEFDDWLRADGNRRNPGATADLIVACLYAGFREGILTPPPEYNLPGYRAPR